jgi:hypothetical protein
MPFVGSVAERYVSRRFDLVAAGFCRIPLIARFAGPGRSFEPPAGVLRFLNRRAGHFCMVPGCAGPGPFA